MTTDTIYLASIWVFPVISAVTFHEAAHGFAAHLLGDDTAWRLGRVSFNPFKHVDPFGTILLPGLLLLARSPFLFGYAKPVPVNFSALRRPRRGMVLVAAAGPATNIVLAVVAALGFHFIGYLPVTVGQWLAANLKNALNSQRGFGRVQFISAATPRRRAYFGWDFTEIPRRALCPARAVRINNPDRSFDRAAAARGSVRR